MFAAVYLLDLNLQMVIHIKSIYGFDPFNLMENGLNCSEKFIVYINSDKSVAPRFTSNIEKTHFLEDRCYIAQIYKFFGKYFHF